MIHVEKIDQQRYKDTKYYGTVEAPSKEAAQIELNERFKFGEEWFHTKLNSLTQEDEITFRFEIVRPNTD